jgi:hypothetical protein
MRYLILYTLLLAALASSCIKETNDIGAPPVITFSNFAGSDPSLNYFITTDTTVYRKRASINANFAASNALKEISIESEDTVITEAKYFIDNTMFNYTKGVDMEKAKRQEYNWTFKVTDKAGLTAEKHIRVRFQ